MFWIIFVLSPSQKTCLGDTTKKTPDRKYFRLRVYPLITAQIYVQYYRPARYELKNYTGRFLTYVQAGNHFLLYDHSGGTVPEFDPIFIHYSCYWVVLVSTKKRNTRNAGFPFFFFAKMLSRLASKEYSAEEHSCEVPNKPEGFSCGTKQNHSNISIGSRYRIIYLKNMAQASISHLGCNNFISTKENETINKRA